MNAKRALDIAIASACLIAGWPLIIAVSAAMRLTRDRGPIFYRACRVGEGGRTIAVLKFRTMRASAGGLPITTTADDRVTPLGRTLRRYKVDELPQLWNVLRGDLSLVGPRPEDPRFVDWSNELHRRVFSVKPGITGLAQLRYRREEELLKGPDPEAMYRAEILPEKLRLDAAYLDRATMRLDVRILLETARQIVS